MDRQSKRGRKPLDIVQNPEQIIVWNVLKFFTLVFPKRKPHELTKLENSPTPPR